jgi:hypothetical protein
MKHLAKILFACLLVSGCAAEPVDAELLQKRTVDGESLGVIVDAITALGGARIDGPIHRRTVKAIAVTIAVCV